MKIFEHIIRSPFNTDFDQNIFNLKIDVDTYDI